jgi:hypothetical protein
LDYNPYDAVIQNDGSLEDLKKVVTSFCYSWLGPDL